MRLHAIFKLISVICVAILLWNCSSTKHVPDGQYLVDKVSINIKDSTGISPRDLNNYLRQTPNHKVLGFLKLQLATYNLSRLAIVWLLAGLDSKRVRCAVYNKVYSQFSIFHMQGLFGSYYFLSDSMQRSISRTSLDILSLVSSIPSAVRDITLACLRSL